MLQPSEDPRRVLAVVVTLTVVMSVVVVVGLLVIVDLQFVAHGVTHGRSPLGRLRLAKRWQQAPRANGHLLAL